jgi:hypothetical protein
VDVFPRQRGRGFGRHLARLKEHGYGKVKRSATYA